VRRAAKVGRGADSELETLMVRRALKAAKRSDVCLLVVDATDGVSDQVMKDRACLQCRRGRGCGADSELETLMVRRALKAAKRSDVRLFVVDATDGVSDGVRQ
jgi:predicted GTPase